MTGIEVLSACLTDASARSSLALEVSEVNTNAGKLVLVQQVGPLRPLVIAKNIEPYQSPFDVDLRSELLTLSQSFHTPFIAVCSFRTCVVFDVDALKRKTNQEHQVLFASKGTDVMQVEEVLTSAKRVALTETLRKALLTIVNAQNIQTPAEGAAVIKALARADDSVASEYFKGHVNYLLDEMLFCTQQSAKDKEAIVKLCTAVLGHFLVRLQRPGELDPLEFPHSLNEPRVMLDVVSAYLREAFRSGYAMFPTSVADINVDPSKSGLFNEMLHEFVDFFSEFQLGRLTVAGLADAVDGVLEWCFDQSGAPVPSIDAIDMAISMANINSFETSIPRVLEVGSTLGTFGIRARLFNPMLDARVYAPSDSEERLVLLRSLGRLRDPSDLKIIRRHEDTQEPWDLVCISLTHVSERHRLLLLLQSQKLSEEARIVVFAPLAALRDAEYADVRKVLLDRFQLQWVVTADAEPLANPDNGTCCVVARIRKGYDEAPVHERFAEPDLSAAQFVFLRSPVSNIVPRAKSIRDLTIERRDKFNVFLRYLSTSERGKVNAEVVVRRVTINELQSRSNTVSGGWDDLIIPPDVIASILRKLSGRIRPLRDIAIVSGGLRTGANDVLAPRISEITTDKLEEQFWKHEGKDSVLVTSSDELDCIAGVPRSDRRLLLLPENKTDFADTNVLAHIERAEAEGVADRTTIKQRKNWWHLANVVAPDFFIPRQPRDKWIVALNTTKAFVSDSFVEVRLAQQQHIDAIALWMNSSLGMFLSELVRSHTQVYDVTVRDVQEFPIPTDDVLSKIDVKKFRQFLFRPIKSNEEEFGTTDADIVRPHMVARDRSRIDKYFMSDIFGLSEEEIRWVYRFSLAWFSTSTNVRHLANALAAEISMRYRIRPMKEWYTPRIEQLPATAQRTVIIPPGITHAQSARSMFNWQVTMFKGNRKEDAIDCTSMEEAEMLELMINLGKRYIELPADPPLIAEVLNLAKTFRTDLDKAIHELADPLPQDIRETIGEAVRSVMTEY